MRQILQLLICIQLGAHRTETPISVINMALTFSRLYRMGCIVLTVALLCCATASLVLRFWLQKLNHKSDQTVGLEGIVNGPGALFRYML
jgi:hypothetical protein